MEDILKNNDKKLKDLIDVVILNINNLLESSKEIKYNNAYTDKQKCNLQVLFEKSINDLSSLKNSIKAISEELEATQIKPIKNISVKKTMKDKSND